jgi:hypothetical protein
MDIPDVVEQAATQLMQLFKDSDTDLNQEQVNDLVSQIYNGFVGPYRPLVRAFPTVTETISVDIAPLVAAVLKMVVGLMDNSELEELKQAFVTRRAAGRFKNFKAYKDAGFSADQALAFTLQDAANNDAFMSGLLKRASSRKSSG